jgi:cobalamin transport system permease protein
MIKNKRFAFLLLALLPIAIGSISLFLGPSQSFSKDIILKIRLPRVIMGLIVGAGLGCSGAIMQGVLRNPLADPYILGTSAGAGVGMILSMVLGFEYASPVFYLLIIGGAFFATMLSYSISRVGKKTNLLNLVLAGVVVGTFLSACIMFFLVYRQEEFFSVLIFMMGSVGEGNVYLMVFGLSILAMGAFVSVLFARQLDIMSMGEEKAGLMGINTERLKIIMFVSGALMTGAAVAISGTIGFVGLIVPHMIRVIIGPSHRGLIVGSLFGGAAFLVLMDTVSRVVIAPSQVPVGILTAMLGAPFFLWLLKRKKEYYF